MIARLKLAATSPTPRAPERQALLAARTELDDAQAELRGLDGSLTALRQTRWRARGALAKAQAGEAEATTALAIGLARGAREKAQDELTAAERMVAEIEERQTQLKARLPLIRTRFESALASVVRSDPAMESLVAEYDRTRTRYLGLKATIKSMPSAMRPATHQHQHLEMVDLESPAPPLAALWRDAIAALSRDPDAALPDVN